MATETPNSFSSRRRWFVGLNSVLAIAAFLAIVVMVNYLASGHFTRAQWSAHNAFRLTPQTTSLLRSLTNNVEVTLFFAPHGDEEDLYSLCDGLLKEYHNANPQHIRVKTLDYERFPSDAKAFLTAHNLNSLKDRDIVAFESNGHTKIHYAKNLAEYDFSAVLAGKSKTVRRSAFRGEMFFTSAILSVTYPRQLKTYFLTGHGEHSPGNPDDDKEAKSTVTYSKFAGILKDEADSDWARLSLQGTNTIPADCQLLVIAGPRRGKLLPEEVTKIEDYLKQGGRLLALLNNECGLESALESWGVRLGNAPLIERDSRFRIGLSDKDFLTARFGTHPMMKPLLTEQVPMRIASPRAVFPIANNSKTPGAPEISVLAETSDIATDGRTARKFPLIVAVEQGIKGVSTTRGGDTRIVVAGDADFLDDSMIDSVANHFFASLAINWLVERPEILLEGITAQPIREYKLILSGSQMFALQWLFLAGLPGCAIALGTLVWLRRRR